MIHSFYKAPASSFVNRTLNKICYGESLYTSVRFGFIGGVASVIAQLVESKLPYASVNGFVLRTVLTQNINQGLFGSVVYSVAKTYEDFYKSLNPLPNRDITIAAIVNAFKIGFIIETVNEALPTFQLENIKEYFEAGHKRGLVHALAKVISTIFKSVLLKSSSCETEKEFDSLCEKTISHHLTLNLLESFICEFSKEMIFQYKEPIIKNLYKTAKSESISFVAKKIVELIVKK